MMDFNLDDKNNFCKKRRKIRSKEYLNLTNQLTWNNFVIFVSGFAGGSNLSDDYGFKLWSEGVYIREREIHIRD